MPKEITHWIVADRTSEGLRGTRLGDAARSCPNALKLGAVLPDLPYYLTGRSETASMAQAVGNEFHGQRGEDTYALLRLLLAAFRRHPHPARLALLAGAATHLQADSTFHPLVFYLTGPYHDADPARRTRAVRDHRRLESLLDLYFCGGLRNVRNHDAQSFLSALEGPSEILIDWAEGVSERPDLVQALETALRKFIRARKLFNCRPLVGFLTSIECFLPDSWKEMTALAYRPARADDMKRLAAPFHYQNPVTGQECVATMDELLNQAVQSSIALCRRLESALDNAHASLFEERGPSLNFGLIGADVSRARFFSPAPLFPGDPE